MINKWTQTTRHDPTIERAKDEVEASIHPSWTSQRMRENDKSNGLPVQCTVGATHLSGTT